MRESSHKSSSSESRELPSVSYSKKTPGGSLVATTPKASTLKPIQRIIPLFHSRPQLEFAGQIAVFLLKVAALEVVRKLSRAKCPVLWRGLQALPILCLPLKWIQKWAPAKCLMLGIQQLSKPLFFLSLATAFSDQPEPPGDNTNATDDSQPYSEPQLDPSVRQQAQDTSLVSISDEPLQSLASENWLLQLSKELEAQNISLPERISEDELRRFYAAANGDFSSFFSSVKKTIRWRETYTILSAEELESWSHLVFWHGRDFMLRPCLFVRLGLASSSLAFHDRPRFTQAIVSQIEHGVLHLVNVEEPQITVFMDCEGLSPFNFPMQMLRSCSSLVQDHYPNHLGCLFIIRLAPVVRVVAQTFIQVLKPVTREKLRIEGETYKKVLSEYLQTIPSYLGGDCVCPMCCKHSFLDSPVGERNEANMMMTRGGMEEELASLYPYGTNVSLDDGVDYEQLLKKAIIALLMVLVFVGFIGVMYGPDSVLIP